MSFEFNEDKSHTRQTKVSEKGMVKLLIRTGIVKTQKQANIFLVILSILLLVTATILFSNEKEEEEIKLDSSIDPETYLPYDVTPPK